MNLLPQIESVTDREIALRRLGGDVKLLVTLAGFFLEDAPSLMTQLQHAQHLSDLPLVAQLAHSLKGLSSTFEAIPFLLVLRELESIARAEDTLHVEEIMPRLEWEFDRLLADLRGLRQ